jgi:hypothetical protein
LQVAIIAHVNIKLDIASPTQGKNSLVEAARLHRYDLTEGETALDVLLGALLGSGLPRVHALLTEAVRSVQLTECVITDFFKDLAGEQPIELLSPLILVHLLNVFLLAAEAFDDGNLVVRRGIMLGDGVAHVAHLLAE